MQESSDLRRVKEGIIRLHDKTSQMRALYDDGYIYESCQSQDRSADPRDLAVKLSELAAICLQTASDLSYYRGTRHPEHNSTEWGLDQIMYITPKTAPCSEIAEALGCDTFGVSRAAKKLKLERLGEVHWMLADGSIKVAQSYGLAQFYLLRDFLAPEKRTDIPVRLYDDESEG